MAVDMKIQGNVHCNFFIIVHNEYIAPINCVQFERKGDMNDDFVPHIHVYSKISTILIQIEPRREKTGFLHMRKQRRRSVSRKLICVFVFATRIVQSLYFLNPKFQASSHLLWLHSPVCVGPGKKSEDEFSHNEAQITNGLLVTITMVLLHEKGGNRKGS